MSLTFIIDNRLENAKTWIGDKWDMDIDKILFTLCYLYAM